MIRLLCLGFSHQFLSVFLHQPEKENPSMEPKTSKPIVEERKIMICVTGGKPTSKTSKTIVEEREEKIMACVTGGKPISKTSKPIVEEREEIMVCVTGEKPTSKTSKTIVVEREEKIMACVTGGKPISKTSKPIVEEREEIMVCVTGGKPTLRTARFLHTFVRSVDEAMTVPPLLSQIMSTKSAETWPLKVQFKGWRGYQRKWIQWVEKLVQIHEPIWRKASIFDAIMDSTYKVRKDENLVLGLVELWCPETNTFVFPWGEATITLEDMLILGGFSVLGEPVTSPLNGNLLEINERLNEEHKGFSKHKSTKPQHSCWMNYFMEKKDIDGNLEHVAFLALWLSRYVFPTHPHNLIGKHVFSIAIHLAQGTRMALAPAVLSSLYGDLRLINQNVIASNDSCDVWALFHLLELWAWEHFPMLSPKPINLLGKGEPRVARWHRLRSSLELQFVRSVLESPENFQWRCYAPNVINWRHPSFYSDDEMWVLIFNDSSIDDELRSFAQCLIASELVGIDCIEQYLPHRVAMQFGLDQDLPGYFTRANSRWKDAWNAYCNSTKNAAFYIPPRLSESDVTTRYLEWWKQSMRNRTTTNPLLHQRREMSGKGLENEEKKDVHGSGLPGFPPKNKKQKLLVEEVKLEYCSGDKLSSSSQSPTSSLPSVVMNDMEISRRVLKLEKEVAWLKDKLMAQVDQMKDK